MENDRTRAVRKIVEGLDPNNNEHWLPDSDQPRISIVSEKFGGPVARNEIDAVGRIRPEIGSLLRPVKPAVSAVHASPEAGQESEPVKGASTANPPDSPLPPQEEAEPVSIDDPSRITEEEAERNCATASKLLEEARQALRDRHNDVRTARSKSASALRDWLAEFPPKTHEQNVRDLIATNQKLKQDIAEGRVQAPAGPVPGPSHLDRIRMRRTDIERGYRDTHSRGAFGPHLRGTVIKPPEQ